MARLTSYFGFLLIMIGIWGFVVTGHTHPTALIPSLFGLILAVCGGAARTPNDKQRMVWMHIAVTVGLLGFLSTLKAIFQTVEILQGDAVPHPLAVYEKAGMSATCLIFTLLCVRSFIAARRARTSEASAI